MNTRSFVKITMYTLFTKRYEPNGSVVKPPAFDYLQRTYQLEVKKVVDYYNSRVFTVPSNHLLCRLITTGMGSLNSTVIRHAELMAVRSPYVAKYFNFTSELSTGVLHPGVFYGERCKEILLYNDDYFNPFDIQDNWRTSRPIKVLSHPISDLGLLLPNGKVNSTADGLAVLSINVPMLLTMHRGFVLEQSRVGDEIAAESKLGVAHFVHMYVLPGLIESHIDICILNRIINMSLGAPMSSSLNKHPFPITDYSEKIDAVLEKILKSIANSRMLFSSVLQNIPTIFNENAQTTLIMPDHVRTRYIWWALLLARLRTCDFLLTTGGRNGRAANGTLINKMVIDFKRLSQDHTLDTALPFDMLYDVNDTIKRLTNGKV